MNKNLLEVGLKVYHIPSMSHGIVHSWNEDFVYVNYDYNTPVSINSTMQDRSQATFSCNLMLIDPIYIASYKFWEVVKSEFNPFESEYICDTSPTFKSMWRWASNTADVIIQLFTAYCLEHNYTFNSTRFSLIDMYEAVYDINLIYDYTKEQIGDIKLSFIEWCINKFKYNSL